MAKQEQEETKAQRDLRRVTENGKRMKLKGRQLQDYVHEHMTGFGYRTKTEYVDPDDDEDNGKSGFSWRNRNNDDDEDDL